MPALVQPKGGDRDGQEGKQEGKQERQGAKRSEKIAPADSGMRVIGQKRKR
jgi:hypothetical protein